MDTGIKYIEMCEKAQEIQDLNQYNKLFPTNSSKAILLNLVGNYYYRPCLQKCFIVCEINEIKVYEGNKELLSKKEGDIWLPRQDQLQEILINEHDEIDNHPAECGKMQIFSNYINNDEFILNSKCRYKYTTFEQVWLAIVMKENYNKEWNFTKKQWTNAE